MTAARVILGLGAVLGLAAIVLGIGLCVVAGRCSREEERWESEGLPPRAEP